ncbi:protein PFF0380w isoform X3 [Hydra vulgaris]|uniref:protein PFF0380w isoform X3 n=1 Tax=Hydra vulgaris TaxID=6087 RepID=UPI001F5EC769|nr:protein PFF0380w-like isoform X2 [Hydra vulgaris]
MMSYEMSCLSILNYTENSRKNLLQAHYSNLHVFPKRLKLKKMKKRKIKVVQFQLQCLCELLDESKEFVEITKETKKSDLNLISQKVNICNEIILDSSTNFIDQKVNIDMNKDEENWEIWDLNTQHEKSLDESESLFVDSNNIEGELTHSFQLDSFEAKQLNVYASPTKFNNSVDLNDFNEIGKEDSKGFSKSFSYISKNSSNKENVKGKHSTSLNLDKFKQWFSPLKKSSSEEKLTRSNKKSNFNENNRLLVTISPPDSASSSQDKKQSYTITFKPENRINNKASTVLNTATLQKSMLAIALGVGLGKENQTNDAICNALLPHTVVERGEFSLGENIEPSSSDESGDKSQKNNFIDFSPFEDMNLSHPKFSTPEEMVQTNNPIISNNSKDSIDVNIRKQGSHIRALNFESDSDSTPISLDKNENEQILYNDQMASGLRITLQDTDAISSITTPYADNVNLFYNHKLLEKDEGLSEDYLRDSRLDSFELHEMECMGTSSARSSPEKVPSESEDGRENGVIYHLENGENRKMTLELLNYMPSILERSSEHESESRDSLDGTLASKLFNQSIDVKKQSDLTSDNFLDECVEINIESKYEDSTKCHLNTPVTNVKQSSSHNDLKSVINTKNYDSNASGSAANTQPCTCRDVHGCNHVDFNTNTKEDNEQSEKKKKQITAEKQNFGDIKQSFNGTFEDIKNDSAKCDLYDPNQYLIQKAAILQNDKSSLVFEVPIDKLEDCLSNTKHFDAALTPNKNDKKEITLTLNKESETNVILTPDKNDKKKIVLALNKESETNDILTPDKNDKKEIVLTLNKESETNDILTPDKNDKKETVLTLNKESETKDILTPDKNDKKEIVLTLNKESETNDILTPDKNEKKETVLTLNKESETIDVQTPNKNDIKEITLTLNKESETNVILTPDKNDKKKIVLALNKESETKDILTPDKNDKKEIVLTLNKESETNDILKPDKNDKKETVLTLNKESETNVILTPDKNDKKKIVLALNKESETNDILTPDKNDKKEIVLTLNKESETNDILTPDKNDKKETVLTLNKESETKDILTLDKNDKKEIVLTLNKESETNDILKPDKNDKKETVLTLNKESETNVILTPDKNDKKKIVLALNKESETNDILTPDKNDKKEIVLTLNKESETNDILTPDKNDKKKIVLALNKESETNDILTPDKNDKKEIVLTLNKESETNDILTPDKNDKKETVLTLNKESETKDILTPDKNDKKEIVLTLNKESETNDILTPDKNEKKEIVLALNKESETNDILTPDKNDKKEIVLTLNKESETNDILTPDKNDKKKIVLALNKESETKDILTPDKNDKKEIVLTLNKESETNDILTPDKNEKKEIVLTLNKESETIDVQTPNKNDIKEITLTLNKESETNVILTPDKNDKKKIVLALNKESETKDILTPDKNDKKETVLTLNKESETKDILMPDKNDKKEIVLTLNKESETNDILKPDKNDKKETVLTLNKESETNVILTPDKNDKKKIVLALNKESETNDILTPDKNDKKEIVLTLNKESETNDILMSDKNDEKEIALALNKEGEENFILMANENDEADVITRHFSINEINGSLTSNTNDEADTTQKLNNCNETFNSQNNYGSDTNVSTAQEFLVDNSKNKSKKCLWYNYTEDEFKACNNGVDKVYESDSMEKVLVVEANPVYNTQQFLNTSLVVQTSHIFNVDDGCLKNQQSTCDIKSECKVLYKELYGKEIHSSNISMTEKLTTTSLTSSKTITSFLTTSPKTSLTTVSTTSETTFSTTPLTTSTASEMSTTITSPTALKISAITSPATSPTTKSKILSPITPPKISISPVKTPPKISPSPVTTPPKISPITTFLINSPTTFATTSGTSSLTTSFNASLSTPPTTPAKTSLASSITPTSPSFKTSQSFKICSKISPITSTTTASTTISNRKLPMITSTVQSTSEATSSTKTTTFVSITSNECVETNNVTVEEETIRECIVRVNNISDNAKDDVSHSSMSFRNLPKSNFIDNETHAIYPTSGDTNNITTRRIIKKKESLIWDNLLPQYEEYNENITKDSKKESLQQISQNLQEENQINFVNKEENIKINEGKKGKDFFEKPKTIYIDTLPERKLDINEDINEVCEKIPLNIFTHNEVCEKIPLNISTYNQLQKTECNENCKSADFKNQLDLSFNSNMLQENKLHVNLGNKNSNDADVHNFVHVKGDDMDEQLFQSKSSELDAWVTSINSSLSNRKEVAKLYAMLSLNYFQIINESADKCQEDLDNRQKYANKAKICIDKAHALYNILKDNEECSFESVIKYLLEFQEDCFGLSWPEINKNAQALIVFLNSVFKESDVITKHIQFVGELVANPKMYLYNLSTPRIELLKTCFFEELKHLKTCNDNDYLIKCFIMISRYFVLLDQPTTESLTKEHLLPFINEKNGAEFLISIVTYMGLFKSNSKNMDVTCDATTSLILLTIIFQNKNFDFKIKKDLVQFLEITAKQFQFCNQERLKLLHCITS